MVSWSYDIAELMLDVDNYDMNKQRFVLTVWKPFSTEFQFVCNIECLPLHKIIKFIFQFNSLHVYKFISYFL